VQADPGETRSLALNPAYAAQAERMRSFLVRRFLEAEYAEAVDGSGWRRYGKTALPEGADWGLLFQDSPQLQPSIDQLGEYARKVDFPNNLEL
jgi:hypothetical protein